ncbi:maestro heat-like repeat-containing protein family member 1 isoform X2 [Lineus longissimus]|uniref:maestro heat-like repeat-containing protein family member 1 isoform X2 n=1 Tax=Lineus longissimus TaxID=88925 RepID=UPI002B4F2096
MIMPGADEPMIYSTGGQVDDMTTALIDAAHDKDASVREAVSLALLDLGKKQTPLVLSSCHAYLMKHAKLPQGHRVCILSAMERIIKESIDNISEPLAIDIIKQASDELTKSKEVVPDWQTAASGVLVAIGKRYCNEVMEELLLKFQPGALPHFFIVQTIGNLTTANVFGIVPFLRVILGTMLPMLGMCKHDNLKWVFSAALSKSCEAILDYVANLEKAPDPTVTKDAFSTEIYSAYDMLFNVWLQSKESKLRLAIVEAVGIMTHIMTRDKLEEQLPRLIPGILGLYKKHNEAFHITQGLCSVMEAATADGSTILEPQLEMLVQHLFPQICQAPDYNNAMSIKNHNEVLRCFAVLTRSFSDRIVGFLLQKLENTQDKIKMGALLVLRHIINSAGPHMENKQALILSGLKMLLGETNNKVKKKFAQVVIAMGDHGYLELEGGQLMVEFIVKQCSLPPEQLAKRPNDPEYVTNDELRMMCQNVLQLVSTTVERMEVVLWPYLLECVVPMQYIDAMASISKNIAFLAGKKRDENAEDYMIDFETQVNIPKPTALISRFMVMVGCPLTGNNRGPHVLEAMKALSPNLHENLVVLWDTVIPKLIQFLEDAAEDETKWSQKNWEDLLLKMLSKSLDEVDSEDWVCELGESMGEQIQLYYNAPEEKNFLYKCLGVVMRKSTKKDFVSKTLDLVFSTVKHSSQVEREGCAISMGFAASSHIDTVLTKLEGVARTDIARKSSGIMGFFKDLKDSGDAGTEQMKSTLMLCYGYVTLYAPPNLIVSRIEASILRTINPHFTSVKDISVKQNLIRAIDLIGKALHPTHLQTQHIFSKRGELLSYLTNYLKSETIHALTSETRALALAACATLVKLDPKLNEADVYDLMKTSIDCVYQLPPDGIPTKKAKEMESYDEHLEKEVLMEATLEALNDLLRQLLLKDTTPSGLEEITKHLTPWLLSVNDHERDRAMTGMHTLLNTYLENMKMGVGLPEHFSDAGALLARLAPRCTDPSLLVRQMAIDCVQVILKILQRYEGHPEAHKDPMVDALPTLKERLKKGESNVLFSVITDLSKVFNKKLPHDQLVPFTDVLYEGLLDVQSHSSSGACVVLNTVIKSRGGELFQHVDRVIRTLHENLGHVQFGQTRTGTLRAIRVLSAHHLVPALQTLMSFPLPFDEGLNEIWQTIAQDGQLLQHIIDHILDMMSRTLPYEERPDPKDKKKNVKTATIPPLAATSGLCQMFKVEESQEKVAKNFHRLFSMYVVLMGAMVETKPPKIKDEWKEQSKKDKKEKNRSTSFAEAKFKPVSIVVESFHQFLTRCGANEVLDMLDQEGAWEAFEDEEKYQEAYTVLARAISQFEAAQMSNIVASLNCILSSPYENQRVVVAAFFAELINQRCSGDMTLVELLMNSLLGRLVDANQVVRMLCIRGLGNVASVGAEQVQKFSTTVLSAMMAGMDDKEDPEDDITLEAMSGLSKILSQIDESNIRAILINVALRIRPCFEKDKDAVRAAAFTLFGNLSRFGDGPSKAPFLEQIHTNFISLLMHLNDPDTEVTKSCKYALRLLGPLIASDDINNMFQKFLLDNAHLHYGEFMNDLSKVIIRDFPDKVNFYVMGSASFFKSLWPEIQSNAAMFVGFLLGNLPKDKYGSISKEHVCGALTILLKDESLSVRCKAAEAMSLLYDF